MGIKHITNDSTEIIYVGGKMIPPGEGRDIDESLLPAEHRDAPVEEEAKKPSLDEQLTEELKKPVKDLIEGLAGLTQEALDRMEALEREAAKPRKSLLEAIAAEKVARADEAMRLEALDKQLREILALPITEILAGLDAAEDEELKRMAVLEQGAETPRTDVLDAIAAELATRAEK